MSTLDQDKIYTSKSLQEEMNAERMLEGKEPLPAINPLRGGTGTQGSILEKRAGLFHKSV